MFVIDAWTQLTLWVSTHGVTPVIVWLRLGGSVGSPLEIAEALMVACLQISVIAFVFRPLESFWPAERWSDRKLTHIDRSYTLLMLLGLFPLFSYLILMPFSELLGGAASATTLSLAPSTGLKHWLPWFKAHPWLLFAVYYVLYDLVYYWMHRLQHALPWWWALHSMHHSQRQMSCWTNDRGSYLDGMLQSFILATVALVMGIDPSDFAWLMLFGDVAQNYSHTNVRWGFGRLLEKLLVDPKFHRLHHMRMDPTRPSLHNCNFGQFFSIWDVVFKTALFGEKIRPTGVTDPMIDVDNSRGLIRMQWGALRRFWGAFSCAAGWRLGDVAFSAKYRPIRSSQAHARAQYAMPAPSTISTHQHQ